MFFPRFVGSTVLAQLRVKQNQDDRKVLDGWPEKGQATPAKETVDRQENDNREEKPESLVPSTPDRDVQKWCLLLFLLLILMPPMASITSVTVDEMEELTIIFKSGI